MNYWEVMRSLSLYQDGGDDDPPEGGGGKGEEPPKKGEKEGGEKPPKPNDSLPRDILPEEFRDRPASEVRFLLKRMAEGMGERNQQVSELREQLAELKGRLDAEPPSPDEPEEYQDLSDEDLMVKDPEAAVDRILRRKGYLDRFERAEARINETEFDVVASRIPDFSEYEEDVRSILKDSKSPATRQNILGAYTMAVGERAIKEKMRSERKRGETEETKPPGEKGKDEHPPLTGLELEIFEASGMSREDWERYRSGKPVDIKVPTG